MPMQLTSQDNIATNNLCKNIGLNIHKARVKRKITIEKLSQISGLKTNTIEKYEMGTRNMSFEVLMKLASILHVSFADFVKNEKS